MSIPIADENPTKFGHNSVITMALIAINVLVFIVLQNGLGDEIDYQSILSFGLIPSVFWGDKMLPPELVAIPSDYSVITYMFLHGGLMHLVSNMLILWVFGDNIEQTLGRYAYLGFYIFGGIAAGLLHATTQAGSDAPLVGASGAVSAISAAYLLIYPITKLSVNRCRRVNS